MKPNATSPHGNLPTQFRLDISVTGGNAQEFELLRSGMSPLFAIDTPNVRERASFRTKMTSYQFADIAISTSNSSAAKYERTAQTIARGGVDNICLLVYSEGGCRFDAEGRSTEINPGDVCIFDMTRPSTVLASDFADLTIVLPRALLGSQLSDLDGLHGQVLAKPNPVNALLVSHLRTLYAQAPALSVSDVRAAAQGPNGKAADGRLRSQRRAQSGHVTNPNTPPSSGSDESEARKYAASKPTFREPQQWAIKIGWRWMATSFETTGSRTSRLRRLKFGQPLQRP